MNAALLATLAAAAALAVLAVRAWRLRRPCLRWIGAALAGAAAVACLVPATVMAIGLERVHSRRAPIPEITVARTAERIRRGQVIADSFCGACHSGSDTMTGGRDLGQHLPVPVGHFIAANLTPAGPLRHWSDGQVFPAIRNSVDADGHWLAIMSLTNAGKLSDEDTQAVIAYLRSVPAAGAATPDPPDTFSPLGLLLLGSGRLPTGHPVVPGAVVSPPKAATAEYGAYILSYHDCRACHGADLQGGVPGQFGPIGPNLAVVQGWTLAEFVSTLRTGVDPNSYHLDPDRMPWRHIGRMDDAELGAIYAYLKRLPPPE